MFGTNFGPRSPAPSMPRLDERMKNLLRPAFLALSIAVGASACTPMVENRGNLPHPEQLAQVKPGKSNRDDVQALLGSPSSTLNYGDETWHYISAKSEQVAFFSPKFTERTVISVSFDRGGLVKRMLIKGLADGKDIEVVERETPTAGKDLGILEQLLGNVGRFSKPAAGQ